MYRAVTRNIEVVVTPRFVADRSSPVAGLVKQRLRKRPENLCTQIDVGPVRAIITDVPARFERFV